MSVKIVFLLNELYSDDAATLLTYGNSPTYSSLEGKVAEKLTDYSGNTNNSTFLVPMVISFHQEKNLLCHPKIELNLFNIKID